VNRKAFLEAELPEELLRGHDQAQARVEAARRRLYASWDGRAGRPELESAREALEEAEREFGRALGRIQREVRRAAGVVYPEPIGLAACQAALPARTALVLFQLTPAEAYALVVRPDAFHLERLGPSRELAAGVEAWLEFTAGRAEEEPALAARLYDRLLRPLEPRLEGVERLLIAPDGPLAFLDPGALLRGDERAIERWQIDFWPSATVGVALLQEDRKRPRGAGLLALADPVYEPAAAGPGPFARERGGSRTGPLPGTAAEVRAIAELFPEDRRVVLLREHATADALRDALRRFDGPPAAVHLACHGLIHGSRPGRIGLELSHHQALTVDDLHRMDLPADLAVLSACETGKGPLRRGEGVLGLVRGFFFAGCPRVVVSNWRVPDEGTRELMVDFYSRMLQGGLPPGAALRAAKRALSRARAHPYHWAAFVLWGLPD
jgi:CHAT domain-containing protein